MRSAGPALSSRMLLQGVDAHPLVARVRAFSLYPMEIGPLRPLEDAFNQWIVLGQPAAIIVSYSPRGLRRPSEWDEGLFHA
jgi:hypothetical protein